MSPEGKSICVFSSYFPPHMGGVEQFSLNLARQLGSMGARVTVVACKVDAAPAYEDLGGGVEVFRLPARDVAGRYPVPLRGRGSAARWGEVGARRFDGIVVNARFYPLSLQALAFARDRGIRPVLIEHGSGYLTLGNPVADAAIRVYERRVTGRVKGFAPRFYGVSGKAAGWLREFGVEADGVIGNAIGAGEFRAGASGRDFRAELRLPANTPIVAFTGRLIPEKGIWALAEAARMMEGGDVFFLVAGDGPDYGRLQRESPGNLRALGRLDRGDVAALLLQSELFCFPSAYPEGLPTSLLEAAACGACIITADVGGAREVVPGPGFGTVLDSPTPEAIRDAIAAALADPAAASERATRCQAHVERELTWERTADAVMRACLGA